MLHFAESIADFAVAGQGRVFTRRGLRARDRFGPLECCMGASSLANRTGDAVESLASWRKLQRRTFSMPSDCDTVRCISSRAASRSSVSGTMQRGSTSGTQRCIRTVGLSSGFARSTCGNYRGHNSYLCFLVDDGSPPIFVPYSDFEQVFRNAQPAPDGQYKAQLITRTSALELYLARQGRFNVEAYVGYETLDRTIEAQRLREASSLSHSQIQSLLAGIGHIKGYDVFIPSNDVGKVDWSMTERFSVRRDIPAGFEKVSDILSEIDVVWIASGRNSVEGLFEVEHSTPIYSGLLRFNDVLLTDPRVSRFSVVSNDGRRDLFSRQLFRPTFAKSGLAELCSFLEYGNVFAWHQRLIKKG
jgi:hypothetical protein